jgi:hypothetical protein
MTKKIVECPKHGPQKAWIVCSHIKEHSIRPDIPERGNPKIGKQWTYNLCRPCLTKYGSRGLSAIVGTSDAIVMCGQRVSDEGLKF